MSKKINKIIEEKKYGIVTISSKKTKKNFPASDSIYLTFILKIGNVENNDDLIGIMYGVSIKNMKDKLKPIIGKKVALKRIENEPKVFFISKKEIEYYSKNNISFENILPLYLVSDIKRCIEKNEFDIFKNKNRYNKDFKYFYTFIVNYINDFISKKNINTEKSNETKK